MSDVSWERGARAAGIVAAALAIVGIFVAGKYPGAHASPEKTIAYYHDDRGRVLAAFFVLTASVLFFFWFLGAIANALREAGKGSWAATAIALGAMRAAFLFVHLAVNAGLAYEIAGNGDAGVVKALQDFTWSLRVTSLYPIAALIFVTGIGFARTGVVPDWFAPSAVVGSIAVGLGGTTFARSGFWAPDGGYSIIAVIVALAWMFVMSGLLVRAALSTGRAPAPAASPQLQ